MKPHLPQPPRAADALLAWFCAPDKLEEVQGDLHELFARRLCRQPRWKANACFWLDVVRSFRPALLRRQAPDYITATGPVMLKNYLTVALRSLRRHVGYAFLNTSGLAIGLTCCLLIFLYVQHELSYDRHHTEADRVYRATAVSMSIDRHWAATAPPLGPSLRDEIPEVTEMARIYPLGTSTIIKTGQNTFDKVAGVFADSTVFDVFTLPFVEGDPRSALNASGSVVITQSLARRLYGAASPIGESIEINEGWLEATVTGVIEDLPATTHLPFDYLVPLRTFLDQAEWAMRSRTWAGMYTYVQLRSPDDLPVAESKLPAFLDGYLEGVFDTPVAENARLELQPLTDIHLHSRLEKEYQANGNVAYVYILSAIALFVLLIACVNFVNLATARAITRMREVGVRKTLGAGRWQLIKQFLGEAALMVTVAFGLGLLLTWLLLGPFNHLAGKTLSLATLAHPTVLFGLAAMLLMTGLLSGGYPALVLSGFDPTKALRGEAHRTSHLGRLRQGLVVFQFVTSIFLIVGTFVVSDQLEYFRTTQLGFDKEQVINVRISWGLRETIMTDLDAFKEELRRHPGISQVSLAADAPGERYSVENIHVVGQGEREGVGMRIAWGVDHDYINALGVDLVEGRTFSRSAPADTNAWLINEAAVARLELDEPIGSVLDWNGFAGPVVGVVEDFHFASLHTEIEPLVIPLRPGVGNMLLVRAQGGQIPAVLSFLEDEIHRRRPAELFRYAFVGDTFDQLYRAEEKLADVFRYFAALAILIACLGLFGLTSFMTEQRTKEIGVRKVLGASVSAVVTMLSRDILKLIGVAFVIAAPLAYLAMNRWLADFAYRIDIGVATFVWAGGIVLLITLLTVSYQSLRAALTDPVKALRYE